MCIRDRDWKPPGKAKKPKPRQKSPEEQFQEAKNRCFCILANRVAPKIEPMVDGYAGFLFLDKNDKPMVALH